MDGSQDNVQARKTERMCPRPGCAHVLVYHSGMPNGSLWCRLHGEIAAPVDANGIVENLREPAPSVALPTPIDDFERRLKLCHEHGVRALKDGQLEVVFAPPPRKPTPEDAGMSAFVMAEAAARRDGGGE